ncbi:MAG: DUF6882 domain-containing protein [Candidatus Aquirickettsiella gammari]
MFNIKDFFLRLMRRKSAALPSTETLAFITLANEEMQQQQTQHAAQWQYGKEKGWSADLAAGVIAFQFANEYTGTCKFQAIGTYSEQDHCFVWSWAQSNIPVTLREHANLAKEWGQSKDHAAFTQKSVTCSMDDAWSYAAVVRKLAGANSVYRGRIGNRYIFMTTGEVHVDHQATQELQATQVEQVAPAAQTPAPAQQEQKSSHEHWAKGRRNLHW